jgi:hypothetical protein
MRFGQKAEFNVGFVSVKFVHNGKSRIFNPKTRISKNVR